jgi:hypothetical protein
MDGVRGLRGFRASAGVAIEKRVQPYERGHDDRESDQKCAAQRHHGDRIIYLLLTAGIIPLTQGSRCPGVWLPTTGLVARSNTATAIPLGPAHRFGTTPIFRKHGCQARWYAGFTALLRQLPLWC